MEHVKERKDGTGVASSGGLGHVEYHPQDDFSPNGDKAGWLSINLIQNACSSTLQVFTSYRELTSRKQWQGDR